MNSGNNQRIAKNTLFMYLRMGITIIVALFASRIVLNTLGVDDYGIYSVVGGVVVLFSFLDQALSSATQRYLSFELGKKDKQDLKSIFSTSFIIYVIVVIIVIFLAETIGLWFLNHKMNFPDDRIQAANWVYHISLLTACVSILRAPFNANIIANEKMSFYAYSSILEALLKLLILWILVIQPLDKLIIYSILIFFTTLIISLWNYTYNKKHFNYIVLISKDIDKKLFKEILSFSGWGIFGSIANVGFRQGINIIINIFFGVSVNAAFGIANQVSGLVNQFSGGFQVALNPQLTKSHAAGDIEVQNKLIYRSSKFSYFLLLLIGFPILLNTNFLLSIWLKTVPEYAVIFGQLMIIAGMVDALSAPLWVIIFATGKIRNYQMIISLLFLSNVLFSYIAAKLGFGPEYMLYIRIIIFVIGIGVRLMFMKYLISFNIWNFVKKVIFPIIVTTILVIPLPIISGLNLSGFIRLLVTGTVSFTVSAILIYLVGLESNEKKFILKIVREQKRRWYSKMAIKF